MANKSLVATLKNMGIPPGHERQWFISQMFNYANTTRVNSWENAKVWVLSNNPPPNFKNVDLDFACVVLQMYKAASNNANVNYLGMDPKRSAQEALSKARPAKRPKTAPAPFALSWTGRKVIQKNNTGLKAWFSALFYDVMNDDQLPALDKAFGHYIKVRNATWKATSKDKMNDQWELDYARNYIQLFAAKNPSLARKTGM